MNAFVFDFNTTSNAAKIVLIFLRLLIRTKSGKFTGILDKIFFEVFLKSGPINITMTVRHQPLPSPSFLKKI